MNKKLLYIFFILSGFPVSYTFAQNECEVPLPPELTSVSIMPETSTAVLNWTLSESPDIAAYIVYIYETRDGNTGFFAIDTLWNPSATSYSDTRTQYRSFQYRIASFRAPVCTSKLSNILSTIFVETSLDTCYRKINISWNRYTPPDPIIVTNYTIMMSKNGSSFTEAGSVSPEVTDFTVNDFDIYSEYCYKIMANLDGGSFSSSTISCKTTEIPVPPDWINADFATVTEEGSILLSFTVDPSSETDLYTLERKSGYSGSFQQIASIRSEIKTIIHTDQDAPPDVINFYRLTALNSCNIQVATSNIASNIVLNTQNTGNELILQWNQYREWNGSIASYRLFTDRGSGFFETELIEPSDTIFIISIENIMYALTQGKVCFYITASESGNPYGITGETRSNLICSEIEEIVTVPNVFTPDGDQKNDFFRPVITFTPSEYRLTISNRQGKVLFETRDFLEEWDGSYNGKKVTEGVYLWFLRIKSPTGKNISRTGTVTVVKK